MIKQLFRFYFVQRTPSGVRSLVKCDTGRANAYHRLGAECWNIDRITSVKIKSLGVYYGITRLSCVQLHTKDVLNYM